MRRLTPTRGISLTGILIGITLFGIVGAAMISVLMRQQRLHGWQAHRAQVTETLRTVQAVLAGELRDLNAPFGDLVVAEPDRLRYKAMRGVLRACAPVDTSGPPSLLVEPLGGLRDVSADRDSILVFVENDPGTSDDDDWVSADVTAVDGGSCGGSPGLRLSVRGALVARAAGLETGAPAKYFEMSELLIYQDGERVSWLGARAWQKSGRSWSITQPVAGPLATRGLRFSYFTGGGQPAAAPADVGRVSAELIAASAAPATLRDSLHVEIALRNSAQ